MNAYIQAAIAAQAIARPESGKSVDPRQVRWTDADTLEIIYNQRQDGIDTAYARDIERIKNHSVAARMYLVDYLFFDSLSKRDKDAKDRLGYQVGRNDAYAIVANHLARQLDFILRCEND